MFNSDPHTLGVFIECPMRRKRTGSALLHSTAPMTNNPQMTVTQHRTWGGGASKYHLSMLQTDMYWVESHSNPTCNSSSIESRKPEVLLWMLLANPLRRDGHLGVYSHIK